VPRKRRSFRRCARAAPSSPRSATTIAAWPSCVTPSRPARGDDAIHAALTAFADLLEAHVRREERELFAFFPEGIGDAETRRIGDAIRAVLATRDPARCDIQD
jgi:hypothetical protein